MVALPKLGLVIEYPKNEDLLVFVQLSPGHTITVPQISHRQRSFGLLGKLDSKEIGDFLAIA